jgi:lipopolysaccharide/colanic/teichoic acid biosynthesis glycosyltransferase
MLEEIKEFINENIQNSSHIYAPELFEMRLKEEVLRSTRSHVPFTLLQVSTEQYDLFGFEKIPTDALTAWKIAVLTVFSQCSIVDIKGFMYDNAGLRIIMINKTIKDVQRIKKMIIQNISDAGILEKIRSTLKPLKPLFQAYYFSGQRAENNQHAQRLMEKFNSLNEGLFTLEPYNYSRLKVNTWSFSLIHIIKRTIDICGAGGGVIILMPILITIAAIIRMLDKGPILFRQMRVGKNGKNFNMYKFRSMYVNAEERLAELKASGLNETDGPVFKIKNDPRITPIGRFIRKYSLDELPQLFNIIKGDMSIVGPRPPLPNEVKEYLPWHQIRLSVKPGLTCHWQVSGRSNIGFEEWMRLDNQYVRHGSISEDFKLIGKTFKVVFKGEGAY